MRKRYFLALAASVLCGMSVEALVPVGEKTYSEAYTYDENGRLTRSVREDVLDDGTISAGTPSAVSSLMVDAPARQSTRSAARMTAAMS